MIDIEDVKYLRARIAELEAGITELKPASAPNTTEIDAEGEMGTPEPTYTSATA